jgi:hypothetical protein
MPQPSIFFCQLSLLSYWRRELELYMGGIVNPGSRIWYSDSLVFASQALLQKYQSACLYIYVWSMNTRPSVWTANKKWGTGPLCPHQSKSGGFLQLAWGRIFSTWCQVKPKTQYILKGRVLSVPTVLKSPVYKLVGKVPYETSNIKKVWNISFAPIGSHKKKSVVLNPSSLQTWAVESGLQSMVHLGNEL